jgi:xanthosine utilization system XapX-like protein
MKRCSQCGTTYADTNADLQFCLLDGTQLAFIPDLPTKEAVTQSLPDVRQTLQSESKRSSPLLAYLTIGLLSLLVGGAIVFWISRVNKAEDKNSSANSTKAEITGENKELNGQKAELQNEPAEKEKQKLNETREKPDSKKNEALIVTPTNISKTPGGTWFIILGSFPKNERSKADERLQSVRNSGFDASIIETDNYPGFRGGFLSVVVGPYSKSDAGNLLPRLKSVRADAYIKSGW